MKKLIILIFTIFMLCSCEFMTYYDPSTDPCPHTGLYDCHDDCCPIHGSHYDAYHSPEKYPYLEGGLYR